MTIHRPPAVAGRFYPADPAALRAAISRYLEEPEVPGLPPKALILPHAGFDYSGPVAAIGYRRLRSAADRIERVVLLGPAHFQIFTGLAASSAARFATPLGNIDVDRVSVDRLLDLPQVEVRDAAHLMEHSLEVHLPFLQEVLGSFTVVPLLCGEVTTQEVAEVLTRLWGGDETLVVVSSDLSHFHRYEEAIALDRKTTSAIESLAPDAIGPQEACGYAGIRGLLAVAQEKGLSVETLDLRNSGDTAGGRMEVVGYGAYAIDGRQEETAA
ncbi:MAG: AmmeMemoRadiSam system protein B [Planctomycetota bacterium]|jgi:AmmeMemoRadiSam system protein B